MKRAIKPTLFFTLAVILFVWGLFFAAPTAAVGPSVTVQDLGFTSPGILPSNPFYFFKEWGRGLRRVFAFSNTSRAELKFDILNERAAEISKLANLIPDSEFLSYAISSYNDSADNLAPQIQSLTNLSEAISLLMKHLQLFDDLNDTVTGEKIVNLVNLAIVELDDPNTFRANLLKTNENESWLEALRMAEMVTKLEEAAPEKIQPILARLKEDLLLKFAAGVSVYNPNIETLLKQPGNLINRLKALDELRLLIEDPDLKGRLGLLRQSILEAMERGGSIDEEVAAAAIKKAARLVGMGDSFHLEQAERFYKDGQFGGALSQALMAVAAAKSRGLKTDYQFELTLLKSRYDQLVSLASDDAELKNLLSVIEEKIIDLADLASSKSASRYGEKIEAALIDIKFLLNTIILKE